MQPLARLARHSGQRVEKVRAFGDEWGMATVTAHEVDEVVVLEPARELYEGVECDAMESALARLAERGGRVIVDLSRAPQISARCLGILAHAQQVASRNGGRIVLCGASRVHRWLIRKAGLGNVLSVHEDRAAAVRELAPRPRAVA
jgi:anti-anti-sigma factor